jgi:hypothetical protein
MRGFCIFNPVLGLEIYSETILVPYKQTRRTAHTALETMAPRFESPEKYRHNF